jgi:hypothetical protein
MLANAETCRRIAHRGAVWIKDLLYHKDSAADEAAIQEQVLRRYQIILRRDQQWSYRCYWNDPSA